MLVQERGNSSAVAMELRLSCTKPSACSIHAVYVAYVIIKWFVDLAWNTRNKTQQSKDKPWVYFIGLTVGWSDGYSLNVARGYGDWYPVNDFLIGFLVVSGWLEGCSCNINTFLSWLPYLVENTFTLLICFKTSTPVVHNSLFTILNVWK